MQHLLLYAGLDFILDQDGHWHFIEINDHPVALNRADILAKQCHYPLFPGQGLSRLAQELVCQSTGNTIALLLPDCFRITGRAEKFDFIDPLQNEGPARLTMAEFHEIAAHIREKGHPCDIVDITQIFPQAGRYYLRDGKELGLLYRRAYAFPKTQPLIPCVNDLRLRAICTDKRLIASLLQEKAPDIGCIPTYSHRDENALYRFLDEMAMANSYVIRKPRDGAGSRGVERLLARDLLQDISVETDSQVIYQPWIRPCTYKKGGHEYHVDFRLYMVAGEAVGGFARQAAAPNAHLTAESPLSWMTTNGPALPLSQKELTDKKEASFSLSAVQLETLCDRASTIVKIIEEYAAKLEYRKTCQKIPGFENQVALDGQMRTIELRPAQA
ncbi:hypothetical protein O4H49_07175 [Kiloniella laminariae]|uniref:ATP-grasp domain-containing protein n=1 Tax=Kiloniella laminariae TaxID=454162 RepID=A0ABT4LHI7_9PROT|nr:hypothetical protein [Kiloniella laminariae]MCZ4280553.1 hypothetical protein [Kiloniella laminariae]